MFDKRAESLDLQSIFFPLSKLAIGQGSQRLRDSVLVHSTQQPITNRTHPKLTPTSDRCSTSNSAPSTKPNPRPNPIRPPAEPRPMPPSIPQIARTIKTHITPQTTKHPLRTPSLLVVSRAQVRQNNEAYSLKLSGCKSDPAIRNLRSLLRSTTPIITFISKTHSNEISTLPITIWYSFWDYRGDSGSYGITSTNSTSHPHLPTS